MDVRHGTSNSKKILVRMLGCRYNANNDQMLLLVGKEIVMLSSHPYRRLEVIADTI
jgi:hypothetical protein